MKYRLRHVLEYAALRSVSGLLAALPHRAALALAWGPARLAFALNGKLRARTHLRLRQALGPARSDRDLDRIAWLAFRNFVFTVVEGLRLPAIRKEWVDRHMDLGSMDELRAELADRGGLVAAVPHMGNWELAGIALHAQGVALVTLARRQKNPLTDAWINRLRMSTGVEAVDTKTRAIADIARKLRDERKVLALLPDVRARTGGVPVRFLGADIHVPGGAAHYARAAGLAVITGEVTRKGWLRHGWRITGRIEPDPALDEETDRRRIMQYALDRFAESIMARPENYFWFNKRWVLGEEASP